jgi:hypothetical protein
VKRDGTRSNWRQVNGQALHITLAASEKAPSVRLSQYEQAYEADLQGLSEDLMAKLEPAPAPLQARLKSDSGEEEHDDDDEDGGSNQCPICFEDLPSSSVFLPCSHKFCRSCFVEWSKNHSSCPVCRTDVTEDSVDRMIASVTEGYASSHSPAPPVLNRVPSLRSVRVSASPPPPRRSGFGFRRMLFGSKK